MQVAIEVIFKKIANIFRPIGTQCRNKIIPTRAELGGNVRSYGQTSIGL